MSAELPYPPNPDDVPAEVYDLPPGYRRQLVLVLGSLFLFVALYFGLIAVTAFVTCYSFAQLSHFTPPNRSARTVRPLGEPPRDVVMVGHPFIWVGIGLCSGVLCLFLVKGLFKRPRREEVEYLEITEEEQPVLFDFLRELCADTGAPFPHRVYVSPEVNAAVFYHPSLLTLFFPTRKNLLIGLGLVNQLTLDEFKAVLAHELGHFSQRSMKLGSYVYVANNIIAEIVYGRDWLERAIATVGGVDFRLAIVAWGLLGTFWVVRKGLQGMFEVINFTHSSLSRQMEFNADLVAVSVTGSDSLIHCLARLDLASEALTQAAGDLLTAADHKRYSEDLFYHQSRSVERLRQARKKPQLGMPPPLPANPRARSKVFEPEDQSVPLMWATHPTNYERERNAKRYYVRSPIDTRSPWLLFHKADALKEKMTRRFYREARSLKNLKLSMPGEIEAFLMHERTATEFPAHYHGRYDHLHVHLENMEELAQPVAATFPDGNILAAAHAKLYGPEFKERMVQHRQHLRELEKLQTIVDDREEERQPSLKFRGKRYKARFARKLLKGVEQEVMEEEKWLKQLDREVFRVHLAMARQLGDNVVQDLLERYRFQLCIQKYELTLESGHRKLTTAFARFQDQVEVSEEDLGYLFDRLIHVYDRLKETRTQVGKLCPPALQHVAAGKPLAEYLRSTKLPPPISVGDNIEGKEVEAIVLCQLELLDKLQRLRRKSIGGILTLQEKIGEKWLAVRKGSGNNPVRAVVAKEEDDGSVPEVIPL